MHIRWCFCIFLFVISLKKIWKFFARTIFREFVLATNFAKSPKIFKIRKNYYLKITKITNFCFLRKSYIFHSCFFLTVYFHSHPTVTSVFLFQFLAVYNVSRIVLHFHFLFFLVFLFLQYFSGIMAKQCHK